MSTNASLAVQLDDCSIKVIHLQTDGNIEQAGKLLPTQVAAIGAEILEVQGERIHLLMPAEPYPIAQEAAKH